MALRLRTGLVLLALTASQLLAAPAPVVSTSPAPSVMSLAALKSLEPGLWQLEVKGRAPRQMCVADTTALVQIEHEQPGCSRFVIANDPKVSTVHYSCQRAGWGRTTVRVETASSAVVETQGISSNAPFDYSVQARRLGACGATSASRRR
jgi:hypothetical protein